MMLSSEPDIVARLGDVEAPSLVVMGTKDPDFPDPEGEAKRLAAGLRGEVSLIAGAGHYPHSEMASETSERILAFLRSHVEVAARASEPAAL